jgi:hypothetical protein
MSRVLLNNIVRFIIILLLQVLVLKGINLNVGNFQYFHVLVYPILIILLPFSLARPYILLIAFGAGIFVDMFYDSLGVHASACLFIAYLRPYILGLIEPRGGYTFDVGGLGNTEIAWFAGYSTLMMMIFFLIYFSLEAFSYVYFIRIVLSTFFSFIISILFIFVYQIVFRTKE